jgi:Aminoglycoside adenylyltransferase, C-terminal domain/Nucleotidyltransferase domain
MSDHLGSAAAQQQPTPYPDVNAVAHELLTSVQAILGAHLAGMYLVGSLALGDFGPRESDLDLIIVTIGALSDKLVAALRDLHQRFDHSASSWAARLDAVYIPQEVLREPSPTAARYPVLHWPDLLMLDQLESGWPIQRYTLREHGVVVSGPDPRLLVDPVEPDELRRASAAKVADWHARAHGDPAWVAGLQVRREHTYVVLTLCRLLYTLDTGSVASKPVAARWAERTRASRWSELIGRATTEPRTTAAAVPVDAVHDALALLEYTDEQYRQWQATSTT